MDLMQAIEAIEWVEARHRDQLDRAQSFQFVGRRKESDRSSIPESEVPSFRLVFVNVLLMTVLLLAAVTV